MVHTGDYIKEIVNYIATPDWFRGFLFSILVVVLIWIRKFIAKCFFRLLRRLDNLFKKLATKDIGYGKLDIISDNQTYFLGYKPKEGGPEKNLAKGDAKIAKYSQIEDNLRQRYEIFEELKDAKRIAHNEIITDEEAIYGGFYAFERSFNLNVEKTSIKKAYLYIVVDDICEISINKHDLANSSGEKKRITINEALNTLDIKEFLKKGENIIKFDIENISFKEAYYSNIHFKNKRDKRKDNPYGLKYHIYIKYIK